jgi:protocatechuate 3,4-dioxygenase beta subunit
MLIVMIAYANSTGDRRAAWVIASSLDTALLLALIGLAVVSVPHLRAAGTANPAVLQNPSTGSAAPTQHPSEVRTGNASDGESKEFELRVVGPGGKAIPNAVVEVRTDPLPTADQVSTGKFLRRAKYGSVLSTDAAGRLVIKLPRPPQRLDVDITTPGYGPYWASWSSESHQQPIPPQFTAELEAGWSVGGILVDPEGKPVEGARVAPWIEFKKRPGDLHQLGVGTIIKTDAAGKWRFDSVPASMGEVQVAIDHPRFKPFHRPLARAEFGIEGGREPAARIVLERGLTVAGTVTDEAGKPIGGALVRTKFVNDIREARTGSDGVYTLVGCEPRSARIVVSAKGKATDMKERNVTADMGPVDFRMKPGGTVRIRVLDEQGNPVPRARIFFQRWRGQFQYFEFNHVSQDADGNGLWVWNEAPLDEFEADICPPGGMQLQRQPLSPRAEEYVFRTPPPLVISGKVIDALTKKPIKEFQVIPGVRFNTTQTSWAHRESFSASDGQYRLRHDRGESANLVRIEADGYKAAVSRDIKSDEGNVTIDFELTRGNNVVAKVVTSRLLPAVGAKVALGVAGSQIHIANGDISDSQTYSARATTDKTGRFHFPAQDGDFQLVITHPEGFAHIKSTSDWDLTRIIRLQPWSRVEGIYRIGPKPAAHVPITLDVARVNSFGRNSPNIFTQHESTTGPDGRFVFERVIPGKGRIGRGFTLLMDQGATEVTSSCKIAAEFPPGKTVHMDLGGTGRAVIGKLQPPEGLKEKLRWNFAVVDVQSAAAESGETRPNFSATVGRDGSFRIDDVPAGDYALTARFFQHGEGLVWRHRFQVPSAATDPQAEPLDLGMVKP